MKNHNSVILANCGCMNIAYLLRNEAILIIFLVNIWGSLGGVIGAGVQLPAPSVITALIYFLFLSFLVILQNT